MRPFGAMGVSRGKLLAMAQDVYRLADRTRGTIVAERVTRARGPIARTVGLLGRRELPVGHGLWLDPCNGVHTLGMRFPVDILILDANLCVLKIVDALPPNRLLPGVRGGRSTVELPAGSLAAAGVAVGDEMELIEG